MVDKFMELTRRILKVLNMSYYEKTDTDEHEQGNHIYRLYFTNSSPESSMIRVLPATPSIHGIRIKEVGMYAGDEDSWWVQRSMSNNTYSSTRYMNIIYSIFSRWSDIGVYSNPQIKNYIIPLTNIIAIDELLNYSDEEFKLYISLL